MRWAILGTERLALRPPFAFRGCGDSVPTERAARRRNRMTEKPVNLNRVRKEQARAKKRKQADANAVKFGRTKSGRQAEAAERDRADTRLDAHRREDL